MKYKKLVLSIFFILIGIFYLGMSQTPRINSECKPEGIFNVVKVAYNRKIFWQSIQASLENDFNAYAEYRDVQDKLESIDKAKQLSDIMYDMQKAQILGIDPPTTTPYQQKLFADSELLIKHVKEVSDKAKAEHYVKCTKFAKEQMVK